MPEEDHKHSSLEFAGFILLVAVACAALWWTVACENKDARERAHHLEAR